MSKNVKKTSKRTYLTEAKIKRYSVDKLTEILLTKRTKSSKEKMVTQIFDLDRKKAKEVVENRKAYEDKKDKELQEILKMLG